MNREPINTDDPQMTAYALGELSIAESVEFEAKLKESPNAARELAEMNAVMGLLTKGLAQEWENEPVHSALDVISNDEPNVVEGFFGQGRKVLLAAAAAVAVMALVGAGVFGNSGSSFADGSAADSTEMFAMSAASQDTATPANAVDRGHVAHVPQLFLADEVENIGGLDLATNDGSIDASYLDASSIVPASYTSVPSETVHRTLMSRVDSYLPPVADQNDAVVTIENRLGERVLSSSKGAPVFVSGFVSMDGSGSYFENGGKTLASFNPVSISGNPVQSSEMDLKILSELSGVQRELERVVSEMPASEARRSQLIQILNRNREAMSELKREFSQ
ncbi:hypothetical protein N9B73_00165 [Verrucomicrobiales bacterium]|nr:hypothetical protein [Verrucomicrobiales bacterium]